MRKQSSQTISEVQKIWYRVMSIIYHSGNQSRRIPSSNELALEFGIARSTVRIALEKLTAEGYLITRRGCGTFTNPKYRWNADWEAPLIGLMLLDCNLFFYSPELLGELENFCGELKKSGWNLRLVTGQIDTPEEAREVLSHNYLDAVITFATKPFIARVADEMMPSVNLEFPVAGLSNIHSGYTRILEKLFELSGRRENLNIWTSVPADTPELFLSTLHQQPGLNIFHGSSHDNLINEEYFAKAHTVLAQNCPDWIVLHPRLFSEIRRIIIELYGEEKARKMLWIFRTLPSGDKNWPGYFIRSDRAAEVRSAIEILKRKLGGDRSAGNDIAIEALLIRESDNAIIA